MAHARTVGVLQGLIGVFLRLFDGIGNILAERKQRGDSRSQRAAGAVVGTGQTIPVQPMHHAARVVERVGDLGALFMRAGDEDVFATHVDQAASAFGEFRVVIFLVRVFHQTSRFQAVRGEDSGLRQQQVAQCVEQFLVGERIAATGSQHRIEHDGNVGVVGNHLGDSGNGFDAADHADLDCRDRHVFEDAPRLIGDPFSFDGEKIIDADGVLHGYRSDDRERVAAQAGQGQDIGLEACAASGISTGKDQDSGHGVGGHGNTLACAIRVGRIRQNSIFT